MEDRYKLYAEEKHEIQQMLWFALEFYALNYSSAPEI